MLLAIDIGNTNVHLGLWRDDAWAQSWRARTVPDKMPDEYAVLVRNFFTSADIAQPGTPRTIGARLTLRY